MRFANEASPRPSDFGNFLKRLGSPTFKEGGLSCSVRFREGQSIHHGDGSTMSNSRQPADKHLPLKPQLPALGGGRDRSSGNRRRAAVWNQCRRFTTLRRNRAAKPETRNPGHSRSNDIRNAWHIPVRCKSEQDIPHIGIEGSADQAGCLQCLESSQSLARRRSHDIDQLHQRRRFRLSDKREDRHADLPGTIAPDILDFPNLPPLKARIQIPECGLSFWYTRREVSEKSIGRFRLHQLLCELQHQFS
jgi:hypothetical protein